jgi:hypothetical protein
MKIDSTITLEPSVQAAVDELAGMIAERYPHAHFQVSRHPDESGTVLRCVCQPGMAHFDAREWPTPAIVPTAKVEGGSVRRLPF